MAATNQNRHTKSQNAQQARLQRAYQRLQEFLADGVGPGGNTLSPISHHIFVGSVHHANNADELRDNSISAVLTVMDTPLAPNVTKLYSKRKIEHLYIPMQDEGTTQLAQILDPTYEFVHECVQRGKRVLIHCRQGINRSATVVLYYFLRRFFETNFLRSAARTRVLFNPDEVILVKVADFVRSRRPCILPHVRYTQQLIMMEEAIRTYFARCLLQHGYELRDELQELHKQNGIDENLSDIFETDEMTIDNAIRLIFRDQVAEAESETEPFDSLDEISVLYGSI